MITQNERSSLLENVHRLPLYEEQMVREFGRTLIVAPQPDAESLGCGGLLALLAKHQQPCEVIFLGDGSSSHQNSPSFPPPVLVKLRRYEALMALAELGLDKSAARFMNLPDGALPRMNEANFSETAEDLCHHMQAFRPDTVVIPWRRDPTGDHRAAHELARSATGALGYYPRILEYPIWSRLGSSPRDAPHPGEMIAWRIDTTSVQSIKLRAISAHLTQVGNVVDDDPEGFHLHPHMLKPFLQPYDVFLEPFNDDKPLSTR